MEFSEPEISQNRGVNPSGGIITPLRIPPPVHQRAGGGGSDHCPYSQARLRNREDRFPGDVRPPAGVCASFQSLFRLLPPSWEDYKPNSVFQYGP